METYVLTADRFDELARGLGGADAIAQLKTQQRSRRMLAVRALLDTVGSPALEAAYDLLTRASEADPAAVHAVLDEPHVGSWAFAALQARHDRTGDRAAHLATIAAAAAVRAGLDFTIEAPVYGGRVVLPTLGAAVVSGARAIVAVRGGELLIDGRAVPPDRTRDGAGWLAPRHIESTVDGLTLRVHLDDLDPFRDCHGHSAAPRLDASTVDGWRRILGQAWAILVDRHRDYAVGIAAGLCNIVPLDPPGERHGVNVTSMDSFGSVSLSPPGDPSAAALGLLHEFQHAKLGALLDFEDLHHGDDRTLYYAPWRDDPRPLGALLHGVYAFQGVIAFFRVERRARTGVEARLAEAEFARWRDRVRHALRQLQQSGRFTPAGGHLLRGLHATQAAWTGETVDTEAARLADAAAAEHWIGWRLRNRRPAPADVDDLAARYRAGEPPPDRSVDATTEPANGRRLVPAVRSDLIRRKSAEPEAFAALCADRTRLAAEVPGATAGDVAFAAGDLAGARTAYLAAVAADEGDPEPWAGLALAGRAVASALHEHPEIVRAVYRRLAADGDPPDPIALGRWLQNVTCNWTVQIY